MNTKLERSLGFTLGDKLLIAVVVALAGAAFIVLPGMILTGGSTVEILTGDRVYAVYSLDRDRVIDVPGPLGPTVVKIEDGRAQVTASPCPHKLCVKMGSIGKEGGVVACVPNRVVLRIGDRGPDELDAVSQ